eukprot:10465889-Alexandrium_andersonii.AAC.1
MCRRARRRRRRPSRCRLPRRWAGARWRARCRACRPWSPRRSLARSSCRRPRPPSPSSWPCPFGLALWWRWVPRWLASSGAGSSLLP